MDIRSFKARNGSVLPFSVIGFGTAPLGDLLSYSMKKLYLDDTGSLCGRCDDL